MFDAAHDATVRTAVFAWLKQQVDVYGDVLPHELLAQGVTVMGEQVRLVGPQGIFKPRSLEFPLSITTSPDSPYADEIRADNLLSYSYRGTDPEHRDNRGLRAAMKMRLPLVYLCGLVRGRYMATWPVHVVNDHPELLAFTVAVDEAAVSLAADIPLIGEGTEDLRRRYATRVTLQRLHQQSFRERVLDAYRRQCTFCHFRHERLLDAAHIIADKEPLGEPVVSNGLALCKIHHAAFDDNILGIRPDFVVEVRPDVLREKDGPTLVHTIQAMQSKRLTLPRVAQHHPNTHALEIRYEAFRAASAAVR